MKITSRLWVVTTAVIMLSAPPAQAEMGDWDRGYGVSVGPTLASGVGADGSHAPALGVEASFYGFILMAGAWVSGSYLAPTTRRGASAFGEVGVSFFASFGLGGGAEFAPDGSGASRGRFHLFFGQAIPIMKLEDEGILLYLTPFVRPTYFFGESSGWAAEWGISLKMGLGDFDK